MTVRYPRRRRASSRLSETSSHLWLLSRLSFSVAVGGEVRARRQAKASAKPTVELGIATEAGIERRIEKVASRIHAIQKSRKTKPVPVSDDRSRGFPLECSGQAASAHV